MGRQLKEFIREYSIFGFGGLLVFIFELIITVFLIENIHLSFPFAFAVSLICGTTLLYIYHSNVTFSYSRRKNNKPHFFLTYAFSSLALWILAQIIQRFPGIHYSLAISISAIPISFINYRINKKIIFREQNAPN